MLMTLAGALRQGIIIFTGVFLLFIMSPTVSAQVSVFGGCEEAPDSEFCQQVSGEGAKGDRVLGPEGILTRVIRYLSYAIGVISVFVIIIGGLKYILSGGDPNGIKSAKDTILYALVGVVVAIFAYGLVSFVLSKL